MIYIKDDFLDEDLIQYLNNDKSDYEEVKTPGKSFWIKHPTSGFIYLICSKISQIEKCDVTNVFSFFREAKENQDNDWRIHNDSIINGEQPDRALVLYISNNDDSIGLNGTAFWEHKTLGEMFNGNEDDFNEILTNDSNNKKVWTLKTVVGHKKNRVVSYPCNYFHSKYPNEFTSTRRVFVMFYKISNNV